MEISRLLDITHIPEAPGFVEGVINLRGQVIAVVDLSRQFGLKEEKELPKTARIVIVEVGSETVGLIVDEVPEVLRIAEADIEPAPEIIQTEVKRDYIKGVGKLGERLIILLVDDEPDFLKTMSAVMSGWGHDVIQASSGKEAIDAIMSKNSDIVILDYLMPEMDGISTLKKIREIDDKIPVIMFTAHPDIKVIKGTEKLGVSAFIPKLSTFSDASSSLKATIEMIRKRSAKKG